MKSMVTALLLSTLLLQPGGTQSKGSVNDNTQTKEAQNARDKSAEDEQNRDESLIPKLAQLANSFEIQEKYDEAALLYAAIRSILEKKYGPSNPRMCLVSVRYVELLKKAGRSEEAGKVKMCDKR